jgi:hypothetical protein
MRIFSVVLCVLFTSFAFAKDPGPRPNPEWKSVGYEVASYLVDAISETQFSDCYHDPVSTKTLRPNQAADPDLGIQFGSLKTLPLEECTNPKKQPGFRATDSEHYRMLVYTDAAHRQIRAVELSFVVPRSPAGERRLMICNTKR